MDANELLGGMLLQLTDNVSKAINQAYKRDLCLTMELSQMVVLAFSVKKKMKRKKIEASYVLSWLPF